MALGWQAIRDEFTIEDIGAPLLTNLAKGIYTPEAMLREYVQNAGDSYYDLREKDAPTRSGLGSDYRHIHSARWRSCDPR